MNFVFISGSCRKSSYNLALLKEAKILLLSENNNSSRVSIFSDLDLIPIFNPDIEFDSLNPTLLNLKKELQVANALLISSPEYIHGIPGGLKNLLDWLIGSSELDGLPTAIIIATSSSGEFVESSLSEIINVMTNGNVIKEASLKINGIKTKFDSNMILKKEVLNQLKNSILHLIKNAKINCLKMEIGTK